MDAQAKASDKQQGKNAGRTPGIDQLQAQRLKRAFHIEVVFCRAGRGAVRIIVCIEDPVVIRKMLNDLDKKDAPAATLPILLPGLAALGFEGRYRRQA